jgi:hypothetical protein
MTTSADELHTLRETLLQGIRMSKQGSYARRSPAPASVKYLRDACQGLRELVKRDEKNIEAWRLLSQAEECLLNYREAIACLEEAMFVANQRSKQDLKRLALLKQSFAEWDKLPLSSKQLRSLGDFLEECGANEERNGRTLRFTMQWLDDNQIPSRDAVISAFKMRGGHTDFMVLYNVVRG